MLTGMFATIAAMTGYIMMQIGNVNTALSIRMDIERQLLDILTTRTNDLSSRVAVAESKIEDLRK
jgi:hypothetical protein